MELFSPMDGPRVFNIPMGTPFAEALAEGLYQRLDSDDPFGLSRVTIYAPTRRGARGVSDALVKQAGGKPILTPRIRTLGDLNDGSLVPNLPDAIDPTDRLLTLTRLVRGMAKVAPNLAQEATAVALAGDLTQLLDSAHGERLSLDALGQVFPKDHSAHWEMTLRFLEILSKAWPAHLQEHGTMDPVARRAVLIDARIEAWRENPPTDPVIVAGSTGSVGISADLISAVARLPQGAVILPGLDRDLDTQTFAALRDSKEASGEPDHPQAGLSRLLARIGGRDGAIARDDVSDWIADNGPRATFLSLAMRPAPVTHEWMTHQKRIESEAVNALRGVALIESETPQEETLAIAMAIRETLETPDRTVALITSDRTLARRVSAALLRWGVRSDDSGGVPLALTPPGIFLSLLAEEAFGQDRVISGGSGDPIGFLSLLKHPLCKLGHSASDHGKHVRFIERHAMRADAPTGANITAIRATLRAREDDCSATLAWLDTLETALEPLHALKRTLVSFDTAIALMRQAAEAFAVDSQGNRALWEGPNGETALGFMDDLAEHGASLGEVEVGAIPMLMGGLMNGRSARAPFGNHPRVFIWGTLEARMQRADRMILGGLNEDSWPRLPDPDPWMSRAMRREFGLPPMERRLGLSAHDFQQAISAEDVILTRSRKQGGTPTVPSRWLQRIITLLGNAPEKGFAPDVLATMRRDGRKYLQWAFDLGKPAGQSKPCERPQPTPPLEKRPKRLSVTAVETLIRDPYAIYASRILKLYPLASLVPEPDQRTRGEIMHRIVEDFVDRTRHAWDDEDALTVFREVTEEALTDIADWPSYQALYEARADRIGPWFVKEEAARRLDFQKPVMLENKGSHSFEVPHFGSFELTAQADRIDLCSDATYALYDYKGSSCPSKAQVKAGWAQQLPLQGAMIAAGAFPVEPLPVSQLQYVKLMGTASSAGENIKIDDVETLVGQALPRLTELLVAYSDETQAYWSKARPETTDWVGDYDHLARVGEWEGSGNFAQ